MSDLIEIPKDKVKEVFSDKEKLTPYLDLVRKEVEIINPDVSTKKGQDEIRSKAAKVSKIKTAMVQLGKDSVADMKSAISLVNDGHKFVESELNNLRDATRKPLTDWEDKQKAIEAKRIADIEARIARIKSMSEVDQDTTKDDIASFITAITSIDCSEGFDEYAEQALKAVSEANTTLATKLMEINSREAMIAAQEKLDAERKELDAARAEIAAAKAEADKIKFEAEEKIRKDEEDKARKEAEDLRVKAEVEKAKLDSEQKAIEEKEQAAARELELKLQAERVQREKVEAEQRAIQATKDTAEKAEREKQAAIKAEQDRVEAVKQAEIKAAKAREADKKHKSTINNQTLSDLVSAGLSEDMAKLAITAIAKRQVRNVTISY